MTQPRMINNHESIESTHQPTNLKKKTQQILNKLTIISNSASLLAIHTEFVSVENKFLLG